MAQRYQKQMRILTRASEGGIECFDPFLVLQLEPSNALRPSAVDRALEEKIAMLDVVLDDECHETHPLTQVVRLAHSLLHDPLKRQACITCIDTATRTATERSTTRKPVDPEDLILDHFRILLDSLSKRKQRTPEDAVLRAEKAERKKMRKTAVRAQQAAEIERREDVLEYDMAVSSRTLRTLTENTNTPPDTPEPEPEVFAALPDHILDGGVGCGGATVLRQAATLSALFSTTVTVCKDARRKGGYGLASLGPADAAGLRALEGLGLLQAHEATPAGSCDLDVPLIVFDRPAHYAQLRSPLEVQGSVSQTALWMLPSLCLTEQPLRITLKGQSDSGGLPVVLIDSGLCYVLRQFGADVAMPLLKRKGNGGSTAEIIVKPARLNAVQLIEAGVVTSVEVSVWVSRGIHLEVGQRVAKAAVAFLEKKEVPTAGVLALNLTKEDGVVNDAVGITVVVKSSTGAVWCGSSMGGRGTKAEHTGERAAAAVVADYAKGGCISDVFLEQACALMAVTCTASTPSHLRVNLPLAPPLQTAIALIEKTRPDISFTTSAPPTRTEHGKNSTILECSLST